MLILTLEPVTAAPHLVRGRGKCDGAGVEDGVVVPGDAGAQCTRRSCQDGGQEGLIQEADWRAGTVLGGVPAAGSWELDVGKQTGGFQRSQPCPPLGFSPGIPVISPCPP